MYNELKDEEIIIIEAAIKGDIKEFEKLIARYQKRIYSTAYFIVFDGDEADDIVQLVFIALWKSLKKLKSIDKFKTWLYRTTVNKSIDAIRRRKKKVNEGIELMKLDQENEIIFKHDIERILVKIMRKLPEQQRLVLTLKDIQGLEMSEIANIMKINESTVRSHLSLARQNFQKLVREQFPEYGK